MNKPSLPQPRVSVTDTLNLIDQTVRLCGWVHRIRDHGKVIFIDLRDRSGIIQAVGGTWDAALFSRLQSLNPEDCIELEGKVAKRPEKLINPDLITGTVEIQISQLNLLNSSTLLPFQVSEDTRGIDEELRLKYRYLDLRTSRMQQHLLKRAALMTSFRNHLNEIGFIEVDTPLLTASTPEGARDYLVPTRNAGKFFALPQSPQQYKQLLMVAGIEKYYQIARCLRDEDSRGDRQPEFTQLDVETSFLTQEEIMQIAESVYTKVVKELYPHKHITKEPWPRLTYAESMEKYGNDKPDLRVNKDDPDELAFVWIVDFPLFEEDEKNGGISPMHHMFTMPRSEDLPLLDTDPLQVIGQLYDVALNGSEITSGSIRIIDSAIQAKIFSLIGLSKDDANRRFGHMLEAFSYGAPPHGGFALGFDRFLMILEQEPNIREVIPFSKTGDGKDPLMNAPSEVATAQLNELGLTLIPKKPLHVSKDK